MTPSVTRAIAWSKAPTTKRDCLFYGAYRDHHCCTVDTVRRMTEIGPVCVEHYLGMASCERCGSPVAEVPRKRYNWPSTGPGAARKGKVGVVATIGERMCRACQCCDDPEYLADERCRAMRAHSNYPTDDYCIVRSF